MMFPQINPYLGTIIYLAGVGLVGWGAVLWARERKWRFPKWEAAGVRYPAMQFRDDTKAAGWRYLGENKDPQAIIAGMRQAGVDGEIQFWGRIGDKGENEEWLLEKPLIQIPKDFWVENEIDVLTFLYHTKNPSIVTKFAAYSPNPAPYYADIHLDRRAARKWLKKNPHPPHVEEE